MESVQVPNYPVQASQLLVFILFYQVHPKTSKPTQTTIK